ncbi:SDR family oxidoreductase [Nocardia pseudobrasiliensis]|uniref:3alpha(Or 20beta)-hydroxysteroid dehydrogenase n=1 Tax=Nocardia pseudobrasiliensis TaxID=45979 RepID=A0A370IC07_9NOCA|nr:SDR family oxidoreductase [Nocardia pseudobrasiliensis]RDI68256.1 3alpha(or 20beta)-hydroxysteroid dehydrogenase [Nocardia pseudobrasiliensis]
MSDSSRGCAIVTGGARGIGAAVAAVLAKEQIGVVIADLLDRDGSALAEALGSNVTFRHLDVTDEKNWLAVISDAEAVFGSPRILVNNAGILDFGSVETETPMMFRHVLDVNLYGPWLGMHHVASRMRVAGGGVIVNISSTAGLTGYAGLGAYVASKWGLRGLTKTAALELGNDNIRVCSVHPGPIHTPMTAGMTDSVAATQPMPRFGEPEEVAAMVRFIAMEATFSTGSEFVLDGGATAGQVLALSSES